MIRAEDIKAARERLGESQAVFCRHFRVTQPTLHRWETRGVPKYAPTQEFIVRVLSELGGANAPERHV